MTSKSPTLVQPPKPQSGIHQLISISKIVVAADRRQTRNVSELANSIKDIGLLNPITVTHDFRLIAGGNRLEACKSLGWDQIPAIIVRLDRLMAELAEIDENLMRNELSVLERSEQIARRKEIYEALHPETRHVAERGGPGRGKKTDPESGSVFPQIQKEAPKPARAPSFVDDTAAKTGRSRSVVAEEARIAKAIPEPVREKIRDTPLADNKTDLLRLSRLAPEQQKAVVEKVISSPTPITIPQAQREVQREEKRSDLIAKAEAAEAIRIEEKPSWEIIEGDCVETLATIDRGSVRLIFADPPYNIGIDYGDHHDDDQDPDDFMEWCESWMRGCVDLLTPDGSMWVLINDEWADVFGCLLRDVGLHRRSWIKWYESFGVNCSNNFNRTSRHLFYMVKDKGRFVFNRDAVSRPSDRQIKYGDSRADPGGKIWDDVWGLNPPIPRLVGNHAERLPDFPTQLPLDLLRAVVGCASDPGDLVVDPFNGSGTTGAASIELGRRYIGIEKSERFAGWARKRLIAAQGEKNASR